MIAPDTKYYILASKEARIIKLLSEEHGLSLEKAMDIFFTSVTADLIHKGIADMHCRSDGYLADEVWLEYTGQLFQHPAQRLNDGDLAEYGKASEE